MEARRPLMLLSVARAMTLLFLLPLLFAHRPISIHPRGSVLRRMPVFYGKRDPSLASPSVLAASSPWRQPSTHDLRPSLRAAHSADVIRDSHSSWPRNPARKRPGSRHKTPVTKYRRFPGEAKKASGDFVPPQQWAIPSLLYGRLRDYVQRRGEEEDNPVANYASLSGRWEDDAKPVFPGPTASVAGSEEDYPRHVQPARDRKQQSAHKNGLSIQLRVLDHINSGQGLRRRSEAVGGNTQFYGKSHVQDHFQGHAQGRAKDRFQGHAQGHDPDYVQNHFQGHAQGQVLAYVQGQSQGHVQGQSRAIPLVRVRARVSLKLGPAGSKDDKEYAVSRAVTDMLNSAVAEDKGTDEFISRLDADGSRTTGLNSASDEGSNDW